MAKYADSISETVSPSDTFKAVVSGIVLTVDNVIQTWVGDAYVSANNLIMPGKMTISGNTVIKSALVANNTPGTAGYYLRTSGTGIYWSPVSAGGVSGATWAGLTATNTAIRTLVSDRLQVANAVTTYATKASPTTSGVFAHTGRATISTNLSVTGNTGIGSSAAEAQVTISHATAPTLYISETGGTGAPVLWLKQYGTTGEGLKVTYDSGTGHSYINNVYSGGSLFLQTVSTTRLSIDSSGNIGIGTASPATYGSGITTIDVEGTNGSGIKFGTGSASYGVYLNSTAGYVQTFNSTPIIVATNNVERMRIAATSGSLLIGSTNDYGKLFVSQAANNTCAFFSLEATATYAGLNCIRANVNLTTQNILDLEYQGVSKGTFSTDGTNIKFNSAAASIFSTASTERMRIDGSGRVTKPYQPYAAGSCSSAYTLSAGAFANGFDVIYGNVDINVGNHYNSTTGKFTAPVAGAYLVMYTILITSPSTNNVDYRLSLSVNNGQTMTGSTQKSFNAYPTVYISNIVYLNANDTVKARFWNDSGSGTSHGDPNYQRFSIMLLG